MAAVMKDASEQIDTTGKGGKTPCPAFALPQSSRCLLASNSGKCTATRPCLHGRKIQNVTSS